VQVFWPSQAHKFKRFFSFYECNFRQPSFPDAFAGRNALPANEMPRKMQEKALNHHINGYIRCSYVTLMDRAFFRLPTAQNRARRPIAGRLKGAPEVGAAYKDEQPKDFVPALLPGLMRLNGEQSFGSTRNPRSKPGEKCRSRPAKKIIAPQHYW